MNKFTQYPGHPETQLITLENDFLKATFSQYGCMLKSLVYKPLERETVLGLDTYADDLRQTFYLGSLVGRCGNRIAFGRFSLNDETYQLPINNGVHHLHGGVIGFDKKTHAYTLEEDTLVFKLLSQDGDQGYPGNLELKVSYRLRDASLIIETEAVSDKDTICDVTQHTYFNLNRDRAQTIRNHILKLNSKRLYTIDASGCTCEITLDTTDTAFDFFQPIPIETCLEADHPQLIRNRGLDNYFIKYDPQSSHIATLVADGLKMEVHTSHMGAHVYSGNYLEPLDTESNYPFMQKNGGICFETQHIPNSINFDREHAPILKAGKPVTSQTIYQFNKEITE